MVYIGITKHIITHIMINMMNIIYIYIYIYEDTYVLSIHTNMSREENKQQIITNISLV